MKILLLAGGSGSRLWPHIHPPKQFSCLLGEKSLLQTTVERFLRHYSPQDLLILTGQEYLDAVTEQLEQISQGKEVEVLVEPERRNTAFALLFALKALEKQGEREQIFLVSPIDHIFSCEERLLQTIEEGKKHAQQGKLLLFGATPTHPHTGYGYILCEQNAKCPSVLRFIEKPSRERTEKLLHNRQCLWNTGLLLFQKRTFLSQLQEHCPEVYAAYREDHLTQIPPLSIDHLFLEAFDNLHVMPLGKVLETVSGFGFRRFLENFWQSFRSLIRGYIRSLILPRNKESENLLKKSQKSPETKSVNSLLWHDIGSWEGIYQAAEKQEENNVFLGKVEAQNTEGCFISSEKRQIVAIDLKDLIIVDTEEGLLISKRGSSHKVAHFLKEQVKIPIH